MKPSQYDKRPIPSVSMVDIYAKIKEAIQHIDPSEGAVDITGGKKVMSSGAAIAGAYLGLDVLYLDSFEYDPKTKLPVPGKVVSSMMV